MKVWLLLLATGCGAGEVAIKDADPPADTDVDTTSTPTPTSTTSTPSSTPPPSTTAPAVSSDCLEPFVACGGDPVGTWDLASYCVDGATLAGTTVYPDYGCPGATLTTTVLLEGALDLAGDGTFAFETRVSGAFEYLLPAACIGGNPCADITDAVGADTCTSDGAGGCTCVGDIADYASDDLVTGTWTSSGVSLVLTDDVYGEASDVEFCAESGVLRLNDAAEGADIGFTR